MGRPPPAPQPGLTLDRRRFLGLASAAVACAAPGGGKRRGADSGAPDSGDSAAPPADGTCTPGGSLASGDPAAARPHPFAASPFGLGVASGDPRHDGVVLWTRLVVSPTDGASTPAGEVDVAWELAADPGFAEVLQQGLVTTSDEVAHSVHLEVAGLDAATTYWYRFRCGEHLSGVGRTRTLPCPDARPAAVRVGFATCQLWRSGWYTPHRHMAAQELDLIVHLGDYIYESGDEGPVRDHGGPDPVDLQGYRDRYGLYRSDPDLQAAHASAPWVLVWDDHEVFNNFVGADTADPEVAARAAAAWRAWWEHMPVRGPAPTSAPPALYGSWSFGALGQLLALDGRSHRDPQPCGDVIGARCPETDDERAFLGDDQEAWLDGALAQAPGGWTLVANPVVMLPLDLGGVFLNPDQWDGYPRARQRFVDATRAAGARVVLFTGDVHCGGVGVVPVDALDIESAPALTEIVVLPISSRVNDERFAAAAPLLANQAHIGWWDASHQGWTLAELSEEAVDITFFATDDPADPAAEVRALNRWRVGAGDPTPQPA
jgi:alkaline phosphatase D